MAMITDYDCWKTDEAHVTVDMIVANLMRNAALAREIIKQIVPQIPTKPQWSAHDTLRNAIMTDKKFWPAQARRNLALLLQKYG
jgi:5'-methylthioadenosine phosphorylase